MISVVLEHKLLRVWRKYKNAVNEDERDLYFAIALNIIEGERIYEKANENGIISGRGMIYSIGREEVWHAFEKYDPEKGDIVPYLFYRIKYAMKKKKSRELIREDFAVHIPLRVLWKYRKAVCDKNSGIQISKEDEMLISDIQKFRYDFMDDITEILR